MESVISDTNDVLVSPGGLALAGALLQGMGLRSQLGAREVERRERPVMARREVLLSMIGVLCPARGDHGAIEPFRRESFFVL